MFIGWRWKVGEDKGIPLRREHLQRIKHIWLEPNKFCDKLSHQAGVVYNFLPQWSLPVHCRDQIHRIYKIGGFSPVLSLCWFIHLFILSALAVVLHQLPKLGEHTTASVIAAKCSWAPQNPNSETWIPTLRCLRALVCIEIKRSAV